MKLSTGRLPLTSVCVERIAGSVSRRPPGEVEAKTTFRYRVVSRFCATTRTEQTHDSQCSAVHQAVGIERVDGVRRAAGLEAAGRHAHREIHDRYSSIMKITAWRGNRRRRRSADGAADVLLRDGCLPETAETSVGASVVGATSAGHRSCRTASGTGAGSRTARTRRCRSAVLSWSASVTLLGPAADSRARTTTSVSAGIGAITSTNAARSRRCDAVPGDGIADGFADDQPQSGTTEGGDVISRSQLVRADDPGLGDVDDEVTCGNTRTVFECACEVGSRRIRCCAATIEDHTEPAVGSVRVNRGPGIAGSRCGLFGVHGCDSPALHRRTLLWRLPGQNPDRRRKQGAEIR